MTKLLIGCTFILFTIIYYFIFHNKNKSPKNIQRKEMINVTTFDSEKKTVNETIYNKIKQIIESAYIISTTTNKSDIELRYSLLKDVLEDIHSYENNINYEEAFNICIKDFELIENIKLTTKQKEMIYQAIFNNNINFYKERLVRCFLDYSTEIKLEINNLQREHAITKRKEKILGFANNCITELDKDKDAILIQDIINEVQSIGCELTIREICNDRYGNPPYVISIDTEEILHNCLSQYIYEKAEDVETIDEANLIVDDILKHKEPYKPQKQNIATSYCFTRDINIDIFRQLLIQFSDIHNDDDNGYFFLKRYGLEFVNNYNSIRKLQQSLGDNYVKKHNYYIREARKDISVRIPSKFKEIMLDPNNNYANFCNIIIEKFREGTIYWDDVLDSYVRENAFNNRIQYLLNEITDIKKLELNIPQLDALIQEQVSIYSNKRFRKKIMG